MSDHGSLLNHSYDGIQEYDNPLPGWWVFLFWASIFFAPCYIIFYHYGVGASVHDNFNAAAAAHLQKQNAIFAKMTITPETIGELKAESALMAGMELKFAAKCATCHAANAGGSACPNLTDNYWLHGGTTMDIYATIRDGIPGKEMKSWRDELGAAGVVAMAAYIDTLRGSNVSGGKAPEGELHDGKGE